jgi:hypothetical protein
MTDHREALPEHRRRRSNQFPHHAMKICPSCSPAATESRQSAREAETDLPPI